MGNTCCVQQLQGPVANHGLYIACGCQLGDEDGLAGSISYANNARTRTEHCFVWAGIWKKGGVGVHSTREVTQRGPNTLESETGAVKMMKTLQIEGQGKASIRNGRNKYNFRFEHNGWDDTGMEQGF